MNGITAKCKSNEALTKLKTAYTLTLIKIKTVNRKEEVLNDVVIKFAGDSGDGMQLTGSQFTNNTALLGIDLATFPDFPAEIRAPQGTLPGSADTN